VRLGLVGSRLRATSRRDYTLSYAHPESKGAPQLAKAALRAGQLSRRDATIVARYEVLGPTETRPVPEGLVGICWAELRSVFSGEAVDLGKPLGRSPRNPAPKKN